MKKLSFFVSLLLAVTLLFSSCGYRLQLVKKEDDTTVPLTTANVPTSGVPFVPPATESIPATTEPPTTAVSAESTTIPVDTSFQPVAMDLAGVLDFYKKSVDNVKVRAPGFTKKEYQEIRDVTAGNGNLQLANRILNLVGNELVRSSGNVGTEIKVKAHDDISVLNQFPAFGKGYGCNLTDYSIVKSAACYTDGKQYKIVITFHDQLNPEPGESQFGEIMTPIARKNIATGISQYLVVLDLNQYKFDFNYTNCEITCLVDKENGRVTSLSQKMLIDIDIDMNLDLILFKTNVVQAKGRMINHLEYTDFDWSY